jgi:hypothetical protein
MGSEDGHGLSFEFRGKFPDRLWLRRLVGQQNSKLRQVGTMGAVKSGRVVADHESQFGQYKASLSGVARTELCAAATD